MPQNCWLARGAANAALAALALLAAAVTAAAPAATAPTPAPVLLVLGDSLSAGYGLNPGEGWVALLQTRLRQQGYRDTVVNASISGDTTAGGVARLPVALRQHAPRLVLIELGANDGLRGQPVKALRENLTTLIRQSKAAGAKVLLFEMRVPTNYGAAYTEAFQASFAAVAKAEQVPLLPFFLQPIATDRSLFQDDGLHPTAAAQPKLLDTVWPRLQPLLRR